MSCFDTSASMAKPLTPITIANLKARSQRYEISDGGCQGLRVVAFPSRRKSFIVRYRFRGSAQVDFGLDLADTQRRG